MGEYLQLRCRFCQYEVESIPIGQGKDKTLTLKLFECKGCKTIGSTWVGDNKPPRCAICYHEDIKLLPEQPDLIDCPMCGEPASLLAKDGSWE